MEKRYQVFISSTFADLKEERGKVQQAVMELDCIPAGMELFPAIDEDQFEFIKKVIDDCDYYLLIIGGRYGSLSPEGVGYTELEYQYAVSRGIKVIAFLHKDPNSLPISKSETDKDARERLSAFRDEASKGRLVRFWTEANELPGLTLASLTRTIRTYPAVGWVRGDNVADPQLYKELSDLRRENQELREAMANQKAQAPTQHTELAGMDELVTVTGTGTARGGYSSSGKWEATITWAQVFDSIAPFLLSHQRDENVAEELALKLLSLSKDSDSIAYNPHIDHDDYQTIKVHLKALGLIKFTPGSGQLMWQLTEKGEEQMIKIRAVRKGQKNISST